MNFFGSPDIHSLRDLLLDQIRDLYDAENRLVEAIPRMADNASSPDLQRALREHLEQTRRHVTRLDEVFRRLSVQPERGTCAAMKGLIQEGENMIKSKALPAVKDAGLIAAAQRVEHYEMAGYGTARTFAEQLGHPDVASILQSTLDEEGEANKRLNEIALHAVNAQAAAQR